MKRYFTSAAICAAFFAGTFPAKADFIGTATINAAQELDPVTMMPPVTTATGTFNLMFSSTANDLTYTLSYSGLTSSTTMAHIHFGPPGVSGAPIFTLYDYGMPPSVSQTSGTMSGTLTTADFMPDVAAGVTTFAQAIADIQAGDTYVNIHSTNYPSGEIRGQILTSGSPTAVPEPSSVGLLALGGLIAAGSLLRRRRSA